MKLWLYLMMTFLLFSNALDLSASQTNNFQGVENHFSTSKKVRKMNKEDVLAIALIVLSLAFIALGLTVLKGLLIGKILLIIGLAFWAWIIIQLLLFAIFGFGKGLDGIFR